MFLLADLMKVGGISTTNRNHDLLSTGFLLPTANFVNGKKTENVIRGGMKFNKKHAQEVVGQGEKEKRKRNDFRKKLVRLENARFPMEIGLRGE